MYEDYAIAREELSDAREACNDPAAYGTRRTPVQLTSTDRYVIGQARKLALATTNEEMRAALAGRAFKDCDDQDTLTYACLGQACSDLTYLCELIEKLALENLEDNPHG